MTMRPDVLVVSGFGLNCEAETARAFETAGAAARIVHLPDLAADPALLRNAAVVAVPGGFSFGDHLGAGNALGSYLEAHLRDALQTHVAGGGLMIGICNGCQTLVRLGLLRPGIAVTGNARDETRGGYECRWVTVETTSTSSPWLAGVETLDLPVAHGEGRFVSADGSVDPALIYIKPDGTPANGSYPANPNGAEADAAGVTDETGRVLALMPHPERFLKAEQHPSWTRRREEARRTGRSLAREGDGSILFRNAVRAV